MSVPPSWRPLPSTPSSAVPPLLVSMEVGAAEYTVRLTDMTNVWVETLDRRRICMRAWDQNTSIDPSDTPENMSKFLNSLRSALDASQSGHDRTSLALLPAPDTDETRNGLFVKISCEIPGLQTLRWTMQLAKGPGSAIATAVVLPLLQAQLARTKEVEALASLVRQKDSVLTKLLDKLEATGTGLENVFTSLSGRKKVSRAAAGDKVRGLAPFDEQRWRDDLRGSGDGPEGVTTLLSEVFSGDGLQYESAMDLEQSPAHEQWWHNFGTTKQVPHHGRSDKPTSKEKTPPATENMTEADEDEFQVQPTPPRLTAARGHAAGGTTSAADDGSTASESEETSPQPPRKNPKPSSHSKKGTSKLGTIGGKKSASKQPSSSPDPEPARKPSPPPDNDSETASEPDDDPTASLPHSTPPARSPKSTPKRGGLGLIGGRKPRAPSEEAPQDTKPDEPPKPTHTPRKLGVIGKRTADKVSASQPSTEDADHKPRGRPRDTASAEHAPRETSQERADRKREELKKELEKKAAAGPAKKKRKF